jgi:hypothetical protein
MKRPSGFRAGLGVALVAVLVAAWFAPEPQDEEGVVLNVRPTRPAASPVAGNLTAGTSSPTRNALPTAPVEVLQIRARQARDEDEISLFAAADWQQREQAATASSNAEPLEEAPAPPPAAPPLPFRVMGRYVEDGQTQVFLQQADRNWIVREGDILAESYKVESIKANAIHLRYLPLDEVQILETGNTP